MSLSSLRTAQQVSNTAQPPPQPGSTLDVSGHPAQQVNVTLSPPPPPSWSSAAAAVSRVSQVNLPVPAPLLPPLIPGKHDPRVTKILQDFPEIFCQPAGPLRPTHGVEHVIETTGRPVFAKPE